MNCYKHYDRMSVNRCNECGQYVCSECEVIIKGVAYCKGCVSKMASNNDGRNSKNEEVYHRHIHHEYDLRKGYYKPKANINAFFLFVLSAVPGLNYMYMGLMKRGMFFMSLFFALWFVGAYLNVPAVLFLIFMEMCYSFFDGFQIRRKMMNGEAIDDSIDSYMDFIRNNKSMLTIVIVAMTALVLIKNFSRSLSFMGFGYHGFLNSNAFGLIIVVVGIIVIYKSFKKPNRRDDDMQ